MDQLGLQFDVLLTRDKPYRGLVVLDGPPRLLRGSTLVQEGVLDGRGKCFYVARSDVGEFLRQLVITGMSFGFDGGE